MTQLQTRRDYLVDLGLAKPGRGKFSNDAKAALAKADAQGYEFLDGPSPKGNGSGPIKSTVKKEKSAPTGDTSGIAELAPYRFEESDYRAVETVSGIERSLRSACNGCRVSLVVCWCAEPVIVARDGNGSVPVRIERR